MSENKIISSNSLTNKGFQKRWKLKSKKYTLIIIAIVVVLIGSIFTIDYVFAENCDNRENRLYSEIANVLKDEHYLEMNKLVEKIKSKEKYENDPHCAYALIIFDLMNEEVDAAELKHVSFIDSHSQAEFSPSFEELDINEFSDAREKIDTRLSDIRGFLTITF